MYLKTSLFLKLVFLLIMSTKATDDKNDLTTKSIEIIRPERMVNGLFVDILEVPYIVYIETHDQFCAGAIVSRWNVITAAHCGPMDRATSYLRVGSVMRDDEGQIRLIQSFTTHPNFTVDSQNHSSKFDIAVIRVTEPFHYSSFIQPLKFYKPEEAPKKPISEALISGWGYNEFGFSDYSLKKLFVTIETTKKCKQLFKKINWNFNKDQGCTMTKDSSQYPCFGDSGGPIVVNKHLIGVNAHGGGCDTGKPGTPSAFSEISYHQKWIDKHIQYDGAIET